MLQKGQLMMSKNLQKGAINDLYGIISVKERHIETTVLIRDLILKLALFLYFWAICRVQVPSSIKLPFFIGTKLASIMYCHERPLNQDFLSHTSLKNVPYATPIIDSAIVYLSIKQKLNI